MLTKHCLGCNPATLLAPTVSPPSREQTRQNILMHNTLTAVIPYQTCKKYALTYILTGSSDCLKLHSTARTYSSLESNPKKGTVNFRSSLTPTQAIYAFTCFAVQLIAMASISETKADLPDQQGLQDGSGCGFVGLTSK
eukprot:scaffold300548_cov15-Tisochrysis_lutea.AAC.1